MKANLILVASLTIFGVIYNSCGEMICYIFSNANQIACSTAYSFPAGRKSVKRDNRLAAIIGKSRMQILSEFGEPTTTVAEPSMVLTGQTSGVPILISESSKELRYERPACRLFIENEKCVAAISIDELNRPVFYH